MNSLPCMLAPLSLPPPPGYRVNQHQERNHHSKMPAVTHSRGANYGYPSGKNTSQQQREFSDQELSDIFHIDFSEIFSPPEFSSPPSSQYRGINLPQKKKGKIKLSNLKWPTRPSPNLVASGRTDIQITAGALKVNVSLVNWVIQPDLPKCSSLISYSGNTYGHYVWN